MGPSADSTPERLIAAAGELFARDGFRAASVRAICQAADANVAAVKYHFGSKAGLYREVLLRTHRELRDGEPLPRLADADTPELALAAWVRFALRMLLLRRRGHPFAARLVMRELQQPSDALTDLVQDVMAPVRGELESAIGGLLGAANTKKRRGRLADFVLAICAFHELGRPVLERFGHSPPTKPAAVDDLAEEIAAFAVAGIRAAARRATASG